MSSFPTDPIFWALLLLLAGLQVADFVTTRIVLDRGGHEQNPVAAFLMEILTVNGFLGIKSVVVTVIGYYVGQETIFMLIAIIAVYLSVIHHNMLSIKRT